MVAVGAGIVAVGMGEALGDIVKVEEGEEVGRGVAVKLTGDGDKVGEMTNCVGPAWQDASNIINPKSKQLHLK